MSQSKGERRTTPTGAQYNTRIGLWALHVDEDTTDLAAVIDKVTAQFEGKPVAFGQVAGVEEAFVDVYVAVGTEEDGGGKCEFELTEGTVRALHRLGVPVKFTIEVVRP